MQKRKPLTIRRIPSNSKPTCDTSRNKTNRLLKAGTRLQVTDLTNYFRQFIAEFEIPNIDLVEQFCTKLRLDTIELKLML